MIFPFLINIFTVYDFRQIENKSVQLNYRKLNRNQFDVSNIIHYTYNTIPTQVLHSYRAMVNYVTILF